MYRAMRMDKRERYEIIMTAAIHVAARDGLKRMTHYAVSEACTWPTSVPTVWRYVGRTEKLIRETAKYARRRGKPVRVIAEAEAMGL
jgi:DNA-binding transcriptional regulator YbjK